MNESPQPTRLNVYLTPETYAKLQRLAEDEDRSMSSVVRQAIEERSSRQETVDA